MEPVTTAMLVSTIGSALFNSLFGNASENERQRKQIQASKEAQQVAEQGSNQRAAQSTALSESLADPFRGQRSQIDIAGLLDFLENAQYSPVSLTGAPEYAQYKPSMSGGFTYQRSPELRAAAKALKETVFNGQTAPTMTDPANYGMSGAMNINDLISKKTPSWSPDAYARTFTPQVTPNTAMARGAAGVQVRSPQRYAR